MTVLRCSVVELYFPVGSLSFVYVCRENEEVVGSINNVYVFDDAHAWLLFELAVSASTPTNDFEL
jgi:hypothetical protein